MGVFFLYVDYCSSDNMRGEKRNTGVKLYSRGMRLAVLSDRKLRIRQVEPTFLALAFSGSDRLSASVLQENHAQNTAAVFIQPQLAIMELKVKMLF